MFVHYFAYVTRPFEDAARALTGAPKEWLPDHVRAAFREGDVVRSRMGIGRLVLTKQVDVKVGNALRSSRGTVVVPISVRAAGPAALFPRLEATLELGHISADQCELTFNGSYEAPLGTVGEHLDRLLLHRLAEASIKHLIDHICASINGVQEA